MIYVMTDSFASAVMYYPGVIKDGMCILDNGERVEVPTAYAAFPGDSLLPCPPQGLAERCYNIQRWTAPASGGHFAAMEQPEWFINDIQEWGRSL